MISIYSVQYVKMPGRLFGGAWFKEQNYRKIPALKDGSPLFGSTLTLTDTIGVHAVSATAGM
jgi:hypothetical protein